MSMMQALVPLRLLYVDVHGAHVFVLLLGSFDSEIRRPSIVFGKRSMTFVFVFLIIKNMQSRFSEVEEI